MSAAIFTTRLDARSIDFIDTFSRHQKVTKRKIIEQAIDLYALEQKRNSLRASFSNIAHDQEMMDLADLWLESLHNA